MPAEVADAIEQRYILLSRTTSPQYLLEGDIRSCFDEISHDWLLSHIPMDRKILSEWLKARLIEGQIHYPANTGTPQGGITSPALMNLTGCKLCSPSISLNLAANSLN